jgi:hypothetical protein
VALLLWAPVRREGLRGRAGKLARSVAEDAWHEGPTTGQLLAIPTQEAPRYSRKTKTVPSASPDEMVVKVYPLLYETTDLCASLE